jgi:hypothetical protein
MAQIDIKNCDVYIRDGYTGPSGADNAAVDNTSGYAVGTTQMTVDGITGSLTVGDLFRVGTSRHRYRVTGQTLNLGNTVSVTFTPGLKVAAADNDPLTFVPHYLKVRVGEGNVTWTEKRPVVYVKDRGLLDTVREGDQEPVEVKLDMTWEFLTADTGEPPTVEDAMKRRGEAANWVTSSADPCEPYAVDIVIEYVPPCTGTKMEIYTLHDFRWEELAQDLSAGSISVSGKCNVVSADVTRVNQ